MKEYLIENWVTILMNTLAVFGVAWAVVTHYTNKKFKRLSYLVRHFNLISDNLNTIRGLEVTFDKYKIDKLSVAEFSVWNSGTETLNGDDIAKKNRLRVETADGVGILDYQIVYSNKANDVIVIPVFTEDTPKECVGLNFFFDYLDSKDGVSIKIYHTGTQSSDLQLVGSIKGGVTLTRDIEYYYHYTVDGSKIKPEKASSSVYFVVFILTLLMLGYLIFRSFFQENPFSIVDILYGVAFTIGLFYYISDYLLNNRKARPDWLQKLPDNI